MGKATVFPANLENAAVILQGEYESCRRKAEELWYGAIYSETVEEMREGFQRCEIEKARQAAIYNTALICGIGLDCS